MTDSDPAISGWHLLAGALEAQRRRPDLGDELTSRVQRLVQRIERGEDASFLDSNVNFPDPDVQALVDLIEQGELLEFHGGTPTDTAATRHTTTEVAGPNPVHGIRASAGAATAAKREAVRCGECAR